MKIQIDVRWPRWLQSRRRRFAVTAAVTLMLLGVPSALAIHDFTDVPTASPFHTDISAMKSTGITAGKTCEPPGTPPTYCPLEPISREAMAAFMRRGLGRVDMDTTNASTAVLGEGATFVLTEEESITVGGVAGNQYVKVDAWYTIDTVGSITGTTCEFEARIVADDGTPAELTSQSTFEEAGLPDGDIDTTVRISYAFPAVSGTHNYRIEGRKFGGTCNAADDTYEVDETGIIVQTFPLNGGGTSGPGPLGPELGEVAGDQPSENPPVE